MDKLDAEWLDIWFACERGPATWEEWIRLGPDESRLPWKLP